MADGDVHATIPTVDRRHDQRARQPHWYPHSHNETPSQSENDSDVVHLKPLEIQHSPPKHYKPHRQRFIKILLCSLIVSISSVPWIKMTITVSKRGHDEPNPPPLPDSMILFHPPKTEDETRQMQALLDTYSDPILTYQEFNSSIQELSNHPEYTQTSQNHFSNKRTALLFTPGTYPLSPQKIGYYTSLYGLGIHPTDIFFTSTLGPHVLPLDKYTDRPPNGSGLNSFWRSVENIITKPTVGYMSWVVSQAAPLRRIIIEGNLNLCEGDAWVSGGFGGNLLIRGEVNFGGQQQWIMRNVGVKSVVGGAWSLVFVGCDGEIAKETVSLEEGGPMVSVVQAGVRMEKPYIVLKDKEKDNETGYKFELKVPKVRHGDNAIGPHFDEDESRDFKKVKLAVPSTHSDPLTAATENHAYIQKALNEGKDILLSPGIYPLSSSLKVQHPNQVILGLGYATLLAPANGMPCIHVHSKVPGVRIAGVMLEASVLSEDGRSKKSCLLQWGEEGVLDDGDENNPGLLSDVFARVGGSSLDRSVSTNVMVVLHSGNIIGDNLWLWRADHVALRPGEEANFPNISPLYRQTVMGECPVETGLIVNGANVTIFGLAVEHTTQDQVIWNGEHGRVFFYQSELPYDVDQTYADNDYVGYRVAKDVTHHTAYGVGIYSNFRDHDINVATAVSLPETDGVKMKNIFTVKLDNMGKIESIVNGRGPGPDSNTERGIPLRCLDNSCAQSPD